MKKHYFFSVLFFFTFLYGASAQGLCDVSAVCPVFHDAYNQANPGGGLDLSLYTPAISLLRGSQRSFHGRRTQSPLSLRFGADVLLSVMADRSFKGVPLLSPETGNATVEFENTLCAVNFSARLTSSCCSGHLLPYIELAAGGRDFSSMMFIDPDEYKKKSTNSTLHEISGFSLGGTAGVLIPFSRVKGAFLNSGIGWSHSEVPGSYVDIASLQRIGNTLQYYSRPGMQDVLLLKIGISGFLEPDGKCGHGHGSHGHCSGGGHSHVSLHGL